MFVMTYSQARQNLATFLDKAKINGEAIIKRADGSRFKVIPITEEKTESSPFSELAEYSSTINSKLKQIPFQDILQMMKEDEDERTDRILAAASGKTIDDFFDKLKKL